MLPFVGGGAWPNQSCGCIGAPFAALSRLFVCSIVAMGEPRPHSDPLSSVLEGADGEHRGRPLREPQARAQDVPTDGSAAPTNGLASLDLEEIEKEMNTTHPARRLPCRMLVDRAYRCSSCVACIMRLVAMPDAPRHGRACTRAAVLNQFQAIYRTGRFEPCKPYFALMRQCFFAKVQPRQKALVRARCGRRGACRPSPCSCRKRWQVSYKSCARPSPPAWCGSCVPTRPPALLTWTWSETFAFHSLIIHSKMHVTSAPRMTA